MPDMARVFRSVLLALALGMAGQVWAQACADLPPERTVSDQRGGCLALMPMAPSSMGQKTLLVLLHGDGEGKLGQRQIDRWHAIGQSLMAPDRQVVFMVRPGYQSPVGNSSGWANPRDDDYTAENIARVAGALTVLRQTYKPEKLVLVGHSGGAATSALVLGKHPLVADAALLLGCPCDVPPWRDHRNAQRGRGGPWNNSLNPLAFVSGIPAGTLVMAATGAQDDNTLPEFARRWTEQASARNVKASFEAVAGVNHATIQQWPGIAQRVTEIIAQLP